MCSLKNAYENIEIYEYGTFVWGCGSSYIYIQRNPVSGSCWIYYSLSSHYPVNLPSGTALEVLWSKGYKIEVYVE